MRLDDHDQDVVRRAAVPGGEPLPGEAIEGRVESLAGRLGESQKSRLDLPRLEAPAGDRPRCSTAEEPDQVGRVLLGQGDPREPGRGEPVDAEGEDREPAVGIDLRVGRPVDVQRARLLPPEQVERPHADPVRARIEQDREGLV